MSGQVKFSSMPVALSVNATDRVPLLVPTSSNQNQTITIENLFDNVSVPVRFTGPFIHQQAPDIVNSTSVISPTSKYVSLENSSAAAINVNLTSGVEGQEVTFIAKTLTSDVYVFPVQKIGFTSIRFASVGATATLIFIGSNWVVKSYYNAIIS